MAYFIAIQALLISDIVAMLIRIVDNKIAPEQLQELCSAWFGDMAKIVVDVKQEKIAVGGDLHADAEQLLLEQGSSQDALWGANFYPWNSAEDRIEYIALINIRPHADNLSMEVQDQEIRTKIQQLVEKLLLAPHEELV